MPKNPNYTAAILNDMAEKIRAAGELSFGDLAFKMKMAPSTLHGYKRLLLAECYDIKYEKGVFKAVKGESQEGP